jgi:hypothetical protein
MDGDLSNFDLEKLNEKDKEQLRTFLANENQKARVQSSEFYVPLPVPLMYLGSVCRAPWPPPFAKRVQIDSGPAISQKQRASS